MQKLIFQNSSTDQQGDDRPKRVSTHYAARTAGASNEKNNLVQFSFSSGISILPCYSMKQKGVREEGGGLKSALDARVRTQFNPLVRIRFLEFVHKMI